MLNVNDGTVNWEHGIPRCQKMCPAPMRISNGHLECENMKNQLISLNSKCQYNCKEGFRLIGDEISTCLKDLTGVTRMDTSAPFCEPMCGEKPQIAGKTNVIKLSQLFNKSKKNIKLHRPIIR